ncbi:hypothetical protein Esi_0275_0011 [Ectocarpus siliculosus]|uniref:Uncharacterized protein n=1 Tax=Ectocarpus siliculosus TaxID=2880 RepID=D7FUP5_ECTSI|nr:hypothetical protein Esi_0275_0011 [Ectocarpus siliculosus]|eukprot:CBJ31701.1 hypothetical protein Esi_0275_0011 [Ectocarpus siliculosus]
MSQNQHRLAPSSSNSQRRPARNSSSSGGGSSSSGDSRGSSSNKRRHTNGSGIGKNRSRRAAVFDTEEEDENVDPRQAVADLVESKLRKATSKQAVASSIPEAADAMLDAMHVMEWCPALRSTVLCRLAKDEGLMFASQSDFGKANAEPENKKTAFKSAAFHLILPFMAYFKGICLTTIDCREHSLLKIVGNLWGEWDPERPITQTELSKEVAVSSRP